MLNFLGSIFDFVDNVSCFVVFREFNVNAVACSDVERSMGKCRRCFEGV